MWYHHAHWHNSTMSLNRKLIHGKHHPFYSLCSYEIECFIDLYFWTTIHTTIKSACTHLIPGATRGFQKQHDWETELLRKWNSQFMCTLKMSIVNHPRIHDSQFMRTLKMSIVILPPQRIPQKLSIHVWSRFLSNLSLIAWLQCMDQEWLLYLLTPYRWTTWQC